MYIDFRSIEKDIWMNSLEDIIIILLRFVYRKLQNGNWIWLMHSKVCVVCHEKASSILSGLEIETVDKFLIDCYKSTHPDFPCGICTGWSIALSKKT